MTLDPNDGPKTTYLLTGGNRGIGKALVAELLLRPSVTVVVTVRHPAAHAAVLEQLPKGSGSQIKVIGLDGSSAEFSYETLVSRLAAAGVEALDVVIANAGGSAGFKHVLDTRPEDIIADVEVNAVGPVKLFHALWPVLLKTNGEKKFVLMTSVLGSITAVDKLSFPSISYGMSKAALNYFAKMANREFKEDGLKVGIYHPGWVRTEFGTDLAHAIGMQEAQVTLEHSAKTLLKRIDELDSEKSGKFLDNEGGALPW